MFRPSLNREASRLGDVRIRRPSSRAQVSETLAGDLNPRKLTATVVAHPEDGLWKAGLPAGNRLPSSAKKAMLSNRQYLPRHPDAPTHKVSSVSIAAHLCVLRNALKGERLEIPIVIPGRPVGPNPEPMNTFASDEKLVSEGAFPGPCAWVPGSSLRDVPE